MAIRYRKGRASPWQVYWKNPWTGKQESESFPTQLEAKKNDSLIKHRLKFERESFAQEEPQEAEKQLTLENCWLLYLREKQFNKKGLDWQKDALRYPLTKIGNVPITDITTEQLEQLKKEMLARPVKPATVHGNLSVLRTIMYWSVKKHFRGPIDFPCLPPAHYEQFVPPTQEELQAILNHAAPHIIRVVVLGSQFGVRVGPSELLQLTWADVDLDRQVLRVRGAKKNMSAQWREVPIRESLVPLFQAWKKEDQKIGAEYLINFNGKQITSIKTGWEHALRRAGITRRIRPYDLRHAFGTEMVAAGVDIGTVAKLMGHSTPTMLLTHYQYVMDKQKKAAVEALPDIGKYVPPVCPSKRPLSENQ